MAEKIPLNSFIICLSIILVIVGIVYYCLYPMIKPYCVSNNDCSNAFDCTGCDKNNNCQCKFIDINGEEKDIECPVIVEDN